MLGSVLVLMVHLLFFFSSRRRHTRSKRDWSSDVCSSDLDRLRIVMSSIMRRRRGLISAIGKLLSEGLGFENPQSSQTGACYGDLSSIAAPAASFNPENEIARFRCPKHQNPAILKHSATANAILAQSLSRSSRT